MTATLMLIVGIYLLIGLYEVPSLRKKGQKRELIIFVAFLFPAMMVSLLLGAGVKLPYILPMIDKVFVPVLTSLGLM